MHISIYSIIYNINIKYIYILYKTTNELGTYIIRNALGCRIDIFKEVRLIIHSKKFDGDNIIIITKWLWENC